MIWDSAIFRMINEHRREILEKYPGNPPINGIVENFINRGYFQLQAASIRRMVDKSYGLRGKRGVYSLTALLEEIKSFQNELTREKFFELKGIPYDDAPINKLREEYFCIHAQSERPHAFFVPAELDVDRIHETHHIFDRLSGKDIRSRSPKNIIQRTVFEKIEAKLSICAPIVGFVDKFIAHCATPESRAYLAKDDLNFTIQKVWNAHKVIYQTAEFLSQNMFSMVNMALAVEPPDLFYYWPIPSESDEENERIKQVFNKYRDETEEWRLSGMEKYSDLITS